MAKYVVLRTFTDSELKETRRRGYVYDYTDKRAKEILKVGKLIKKVTRDMKINPAVDTTAIDVELVETNIEPEENADSEENTDTEVE